MDIVFPSFLHPKDLVAIVSPAGKIATRLIEGAKNILNSWGLEVWTGPHANGANGSYSGTVKQRTDDLQEAMNNPHVKAILCGRGGYGSVHLINHLDFTLFDKHPKWLIGFSDITALHYLFQARGYATIHSPMAAHLTNEAADDPCTLYLRDILFGKLTGYSTSGHPLNREGMAKGVLRGGNMAVAHGLRGTPYDIPAKGTILFLEDVNEQPHSIERMMYNLKLGGVLENLSGLVIGQFTQYKESLCLGKPLYEALSDMLVEYNYPICFNFPVGHVKYNLPLIEGAEIELSVTKRKVKMEFTGIEKTYN